MAQTVYVILRPADRERLTTIVSDRNRQRKHLERAQVILASAEGGPVQQVAAQLGVHITSIRTPLATSSSNFAAAAATVPPPRAGSVAASGGRSA